MLYLHKVLKITSMRVTLPTVKLTLPKYVYSKKWSYLNCIDALHSSGHRKHKSVALP